jgi:hypothetical protein
MPISRAQLLKELLPGLEKLFGTEYAKTHHIEYRMYSNKGKYSIYKWEYNGGIRKKSTTLVKGVDKDTATGMMKLLKEPK